MKRGKVPVVFIGGAAPALQTAGILYSSKKLLVNSLVFNGKKQDSYEAALVGHKDLIDVPRNLKETVLSKTLCGSTILSQTRIIVKNVRAYLPFLSQGFEESDSCFFYRVQEQVEKIRRAFISTYPYSNIIVKKTIAQLKKKYKAEGSISNLLFDFNGNVQGESTAFYYHKQKRSRFMLQLFDLSVNGFFLDPAYLIPGDECDIIKLYEKKLNNGFKVEGDVDFGDIISSLEKAGYYHLEVESTISTDNRVDIDLFTNQVDSQSLSLDVIPNLCQTLEARVVTTVVTTIENPVFPVSGGFLILPSSRERFVTGYNLGCAVAYKNAIVINPSTLISFEEFSEECIKARFGVYPE